MRTFLITLILSFSVGCKQSAHKIVDRYPSGQIETEYIYRDKSDTTRYICNVYYENGKLKHKTEIISGMFVGAKISYYENGSIERIEKLTRPTRLEDTAYDCHITIYRIDGSKENEHTYIDNKINGMVKDYDSTGNITRTAEFTNGKITGKEIYFYKSGKIKSITFAKDDKQSGFDIDFKENGDTLKWFNNNKFGVNGVFRKKWLVNGNILIGSWGDTLNTYVIWRWYDKNNKMIKTKIDTPRGDKYIDPE